MSFRCVVVTPEQQTLDETANQAILPAHDGLLGILTDRAPILVKLGIGPLRIDLAGGQKRTYFIDGGIAQMKDNNLTILTQQAIAPENIDVAAAKAEYDAARARTPADAKDAQERERSLERSRVKQEMAAKKA